MHCAGFAHRPIGGYSPDFEIDLVASGTWPTPQAGAAARGLIKGREPGEIAAARTESTLEQSWIAVPAIALFLVNPFGLRYDTAAAVAFTVIQMFNGCHVV